MLKTALPTLFYNIMEILGRFRLFKRAAMVARPFGGGAEEFFDFRESGFREELPRAGFGQHIAPSGKGVQLQFRIGEDLRASLPATRPGSSMAPGSTSSARR